jgi:Fe-S cluster biogenesis protein NfuA
MGSFRSWLQKMFGIPAGASEKTDTSPEESIDPPVVEESPSYEVIRVQPTPNPEAFQYIMNRSVIADGTLTFESAEEAKGDPLGEALFEIFGVVNVFLKENFVTVTKSNVVGWHTVMETVGETIQEHLKFYEGKNLSEENKPAIDPILEGFNKEEFPGFSDEEKTKVIDALLDAAIRPALSNDGGGIDVVGIEGSVVKIHYQGACGSCPSSTTGTLSYIENFLKEAVHSELQVQAN